MIKTLIYSNLPVNKISRFRDLNTWHKIKAKRNFGVERLFFSLFK
jgi:hypothetical protein